MFEVTSTARVALWRVLERLAPNSLDHEVGFRIVPAQVERNDPNSVGLKLDMPRAGDEIYPHAERNVVLLDHDMSLRLDGLILDVTESPAGRRLEIR